MNYKLAKTFIAPRGFPMLENDQCVAKNKTGERCRRYATALFIREAIAGYGADTVGMCDQHARVFMDEWYPSITVINPRAEAIYRSFPTEGRIRKVSAPAEAANASERPLSPRSANQGGT